VEQVVLMAAVAAVAVLAKTQDLVAQVEQVV
jgi:hypothetical protein